MALPVGVDGQLLDDLRERVGRVRDRHGGECLKWNLRQRPDENLVRRRLNFKRLRPALLFQPRRKAAHGGETDERRVNRVRRYPPWLQRNAGGCGKMNLPSSRRLPPRPTTEFAFSANQRRQRKPARQPRPINIRIQPVILCGGRGTLLCEHAPDQCVVQRKFVLPQPSTTQSPARTKRTNSAGDVFSIASRFVPRLGFFPRQSVHVREHPLDLSPESCALGIQMDCQGKFRRTVGRVTHIQEPFGSQQIIKQRPQLSASSPRQRGFLVEPFVRRAGKFVQCLLTECRASGEHQRLVNATALVSAEICSAPAKWICAIKSGGSGDAWAAAAKIAQSKIETSLSLKGFLCQMRRLLANSILFLTSAICALLEIFQRQAAQLLLYSRPLPRKRGYQNESSTQRGHTIF